MDSLKKRRIVNLMLSMVRMDCERRLEQGYVPVVDVYGGEICNLSWVQINRSDMLEYILELEKSKTKMAEFSKSHKNESDENNQG